jgi:hypothetical protein
VRRRKRATDEREERQQRRRSTTWWANDDDDVVGGGRRADGPGDEQDWTGKDSDKHRVWSEAGSAAYHGWPRRMQCMWLPAAVHRRLTNADGGGPSRRFVLGAGADVGAGGGMIVVPGVKPSS